MALVPRNILRFLSARSRVPTAVMVRGRSTGTRLDYWAAAPFTQEQAGCFLDAMRRQGERRAIGIAMIDATRDTCVADGTCRPGPTSVCGLDGTNYPGYC